MNMKTYFGDAFSVYALTTLSVSGLAEAEMAQRARSIAARTAAVLFILSSIDWDFLLKATRMEAGNPPRFG